MPFCIKAYFCLAMAPTGKILVLGAGGQIGIDLLAALRARYGNDRVIASDVKPMPADEGPSEQIDVLDFNKLSRVITRHGVSEVYLLAALLSATAEQKPKLGWKLNMEGLFNVLDLAVPHKLKVFWPSSIAVFGATTPKIHTPQQTVMEPTTVYGISKQAGERWCEYYHHKYGVDVRSIRYPGLISYKAPPGGGTTDYAVNIFHAAIETNRFECFLAENTVLPMMYMPDAIRATITLMEVPAERVRIRNSYNAAALSFSPAELAGEIRSHLPDFTISYRPDYRQDIAATWPQSIDDRPARKDWGWHSAFSLSAMTADMITRIRELKNRPAEPVSK
jgi:nucleoside-diphosphate-sugar epimerase